MGIEKRDSKMQKTVIKPIITEDGLLIPIKYIKELGNTDVEFQNNTIIIILLNQQIIQGDYDFLLAKDGPS